MINMLIYIVSTILTYVLGILAKKFKWNQTLPIPVQNIMVGLTVFVIAWTLTKTPNPETLFEQIMASLGGAGTATLGYDTTKINKGE